MSATVAHYVTMMRGKRIAYLAGPFEERETALNTVDRARRLACELDPFAWFDTFGTAARTSHHHPVGSLNDRLGLAPAEAPQLARS